METAQQSAQNTSSQLDTEHSELSPPAQPKPSRWKRALTQVYSPAGELTQKEFIFWAIFLMVVSNIILTTTWLAFISSGVVKFRSLPFPFTVTIYIFKCCVHILLLYYPYANICAKRIRNMGIYSSYTLEIVFFLILSCEFAVWLEKLFAVNYIVYILFFVVLSFKISFKTQMHTYNALHSHSIHTNAGCGDVLPIAQPIIFRWKARLATLYSPSGEVTQKEFIFLAIFVLTICRCIQVLSGFSQIYLAEKFDLLHASLLTKIIASVLGLAMEILLFQYPYINICIKRIRNIGIYSKYTLPLLVLLLFAFECIMRTEQFSGLAYALYVSFCLLIACKSSIKK